MDFQSSSQNMKNVIAGGEVFNHWEVQESPHAIVEKRGMVHRFSQQYVI
jgi:hypothetical protein